SLHRRVKSPTALPRGSVPEWSPRRRDRAPPTGRRVPHRAPQCSISVFQEAPNPVQGVPEQPIAVVLSLQIESMLPIVVATPHERPLESRIAAAHENQCRPESPITAEG